MSTGPDPDAVQFERAHRRGQRRLALVVAVLVLVPLSWLAVTELRVASARREARLNASQKAELSALLDRREALGRERVVKWNAAIQPDALTRLTPGAEECPVKLEPPAQLSAAAYVKFATHDTAFGAWTLCLLRPAADAPSCARKYEVPADITSMRARLADDEAYVWDLEAAKAAPPAEEPPGVVVLIDTELRPTVHSPAVGKVTVVPGTAAGRSFLFDPGQGGVICSGDVAVKNSKSVEIEYSHFGAGAAEQQTQAEYEARLALERDLEVHLRFAASRALRQVSAPAN